MSLPFIAIFGGSFDPIHNGHIQLAEIVSRSIENTEIYFVPCGHPVHRAPSQISNIDRLRMVELAIASHPHWHLDTFEIDRKDPSYTLDTLKYFRQRFPENPMGFMMGMDSFLNIETWGNWQELLTYAHLLIIPRENCHSVKVIPLTGNENLLRERHNGSIMLLSETPQSVSSTEVRTLLNQGDDASSFLLKAVYDYIKQQKLYS